MEQVDVIDRVIKNAISVMESSKYQIFEILDNARSEMRSLNQELQHVMKEAGETVDRVDILERDYRLARIRLTEVSRDFVRFTEADIKAAYEKATQIQLDLMIFREKEIYLRARRDDLQKRVRNVEKSIERAETIGSQMNVVLEYLSGDLNQVTRILESAKNRQLIGLKIIVAQEEERKRIAREIHDGPAQSLANLVLRTEIVERMMHKQDFTQVLDEIIDLKSQIRSGLEEIRKVIFNLRPMALDDLGLIPTLRKFVHDFEEKTRIRTTFEVRGKELRLNSGMEAAIFRLVQEAFTNTMKHAHASYVSLDITFQAQMVKLVIQDNGQGFNKDSLSEKQKKHTHFGLIGMQERVELLEGRMDVESTENVGTKIIFVIPTNANSREELQDGYENNRYDKN
ncbi:sensor histidine kinase [Paenibacillus terrigena]|uniref:sensor histidine kinase n=1 Tax=Paenibacillus terrigena TaxID=369333 RepID=UPI0028D51B28|nr:sensor histidine kinase [Paenibacillus terrigena]